jgi:hypothetical protein
MHMNIEYSIGQLVRAKRTIDAAATDELPAQFFCTAGDVLEIRSIDCLREDWPIVVAHPDMPPNKGFRVDVNEIEPLAAAQEGV